ncbi:hypothetical protein KY49_733 [Burkholderia sp. MSHR3999]|uniref:hypothetical protein n=1 Tax=Burkholderia sp. MSHR3999 TaxID=1542965 RepID=UPI0005B6B65B|nr:hypothetical protein [Burkholderia sp. MSHR3999]KIP13789.1 hypothetical protein KY49_733 [Burkholderia sp. MSHR3999]
MQGFLVNPVGAPPNVAPGQVIPPTGTGGWGRDCAPGIRGTGLNADTQNDILGNMLRILQVANVQPTPNRFDDLLDALRVIFQASSAYHAITPNDFGAAGDRITDDTSAVIKAYKAAAASGKELLLTNWYRCTSQVQFELASVATTGVRIIGIGRQNCGLVFDNNVAAPNLLITSESKAAFYPEYVGWGVKGNVAGVVLQVGDEGLKDEINELTLDLVVNNGSNSPDSCAVEMNGVFNPKVRLVANCGGSGYGDALRLRQTQFGVFEGSFGNAGNCIHLTGGYSVGNKFDGLDMEMAACAIAIDSRTAVHNTWIGGTIANVLNGVNATAGSSNMLVNPNIGIPFANLVASAVGFTVDIPDVSLLGTPAVPLSGAQYTNSSGQRQFVNLIGGTVSAVQMNGAVIAKSTDVGFMLNPGASVTLAYTSPPAWVFTPLSG